VIFLGIKIRKCTRCDRYTLEEVCPKCGARAASPIPARYSPLDPYGKYRRQAKRKEIICERQK
jgi:H/ACA ribonucleoprotein complex subunit 3